MAMDKGWIKIHRSIIENWVYANPNTLKAFLHLCLTVNIKEKKTMIDGNFVTVAPGQRITSETKLAEELGYTWRTTTKALKDLEADDMIKRQPIGRGFIVTVTNFGKYQPLLESSVPSSLPSNITSNIQSNISSRQLKKDKEQIRMGKTNPLKNPPKRVGWVGKERRPE